MNGGSEKPPKRSNVYNIIDGKLLRDESKQPSIPPDDFADVKELDDSDILKAARETVEKFPDIASLARDINRQEIALGRIPSEGNLERARKDYEDELRQAKDQASVLTLDGFKEYIKVMFTEYDWEQTVFLNTRYVAYARAYLEKFDPDYPLPDMKLQ